MSRKSLYFGASVSLMAFLSLANSLVYNGEWASGFRPSVGHIVTSFCFHGYLLFMASGTTFMFMKIKLPLKMDLNKNEVIKSKMLSKEV